MSNNDVKSRIESRMALQEKPAEQAKRVSAEQTVAAAAPVQTAAQIFDMANNDVYKIMSDAAKSDAQKIEWLSAYLAPHNGDIEAAIAHQAFFEQYFANRQSDRTQISEGAITSMIAELERTTASEVEKIVVEVTKVGKGTAEINKLLKAMHDARLSGETVEQITQAMAMNDRLVQEIASLGQRLKLLETMQAQKQTFYDGKLDLKIASEQGLGNQVLRFFGPDKKVMQAIVFAAEELQTAQNDVTDVQRALEERGTLRRTELESGPLTILRTLDLTENGITQQIIQTGKNCLAMIAGIRTSANILLADNARSRVAARAIQKQITAEGGMDTILKNAIRQASFKTKGFSEELKTRMDGLTEVIAAEGDSTEGALKQVERSRVEQTYKATLGHHQDLGKSVVSFETMSAENARAEAQADQFVATVNAHYEIVSGLQNEALPVTARGLNMSLEQAFALRTGELGAAMVEVTKRAREASDGSMAGLTQAQSEMREAEIKRLDATIKALEEAQMAVDASITGIIDHGLAKNTRIELMTENAAKLRNVMQEFNEVGAILTAQSKSEATSESASRPAAPSSLPAPGKLTVVG